MSPIDKLQELLARLPGVGPRQARRFVFFLLSTPQDYIHELTQTIDELRSSRHHCMHCNRLYFQEHSYVEKNRCPTCANPKRDASRVLIVAKQADFENIEESRVWNGHYFILGSTVRLRHKNPADRLPLGLLRQRISQFDLQEVVMGLPLNVEGEYTTNVIEDELQVLIKESNIKLSHLARGLSSGSELEYSDPQTIASALNNRS